MSFLAPLLLLGLAGLAIPIVVHLIEKERADVIEFPSVMFLERIPYPSMKRRRLRDWWLLALRCAALALLVAAFARPFFAGSTLAAGATGGAREVVILLDQSYSMGYGDRWSRATTAAGQAIDALGPEDRATLIRFSRGATARPRSTTDRASLRAAVEAADLSPEVTRYGSAIKLAQGVFELSTLANREAILITDFQRSGWDGSETASLPTGVILTPIDVSESETSNVAVVGVSFERGRFSGRERVTTSARLVNRGATPIVDRDIAIAIDSATIETKTFSLEPNGVGAVTFAPFTLTEPFTRGVVRMAADRLPQDDEFRFVLSPDEAIAVLILEDANPARDSSLYVRRALDIGRSPAFDVLTRRVNQATVADLERRRLVILNDARLPDGAMRRALVGFVEGGGGLLVVLGERSAWPAEGADLLPGTFGSPTDRPGTRGGRLGFVDYSHPAFELFGNPRSGDLGAARFFRHRPLSVSDAESVIARFDDGSVALAERRVGAGRVVVWTTTLDSFWNDLALKPVFLPFVHKLSEYLAGFTPGAPWFTVGQVLRLAAASADSTPDDAITVLPVDSAIDRVALSPSGQHIELVGASGLLELTEAGYYEVRTPGVEDNRPRTVAVNLDGEESNLATLDPQELAGAVAGRADVARPVQDTAELTIEEREGRQSLWWYLLVAVCLLLAAETVWSNRLPGLRR